MVYDPLAHRPVQKRPIVGLLQNLLGAETPQELGELSRRHPAEGSGLAQGGIGIGRQDAAMLGDERQKLLDER